MTKDEPVCKPECPDRTATCHGECEKYLEQFQKSFEKKSQDRICNEYRQVYKNAQARRDYRSTYEWRRKMKK